MSTEQPTMVPVVCTPYYQGHSESAASSLATGCYGCWPECQVGCTTRHKSVDREVQTGLLGVGA